LTFTRKLPFLEDDINLTLTSPSEETYYADYTNNLWRYVSRVDLFSHMFTDGVIEPGVWTVSYDVFFQLGSRSMSLAVFVDSDIRVKISDFPVRQLNTDPLEIEVEVKDFDTPITDAVVSVEVVIPNDPDPIIENIPLVHNQDNEGTYQLSYVPYPHDGEITFNTNIDIPSHSAERMSTHKVIYDHDEEFIPVIEVSIHELPPDHYYQDPLGFSVELECSFGPITNADVWVEMVLEVEEPEPDVINLEIELEHDENSEGLYSSDYTFYPNTGDLSVEFHIYIPFYDEYTVYDADNILIYGDM